MKTGEAAIPVAMQRKNMYDKRKWISINLVNKYKIVFILIQTKAYVLQKIFNIDKPDNVYLLNNNSTRF